jgi:hypothetical protein
MKKAPWHTAVAAGLTVALVFSVDAATLVSGGTVANGTEQGPAAKAARPVSELPTIAREGLGSVALGAVYSGDAGLCRCAP